VKRLLIALLAALLASCSMFPAYKRPEVNTPAEFRGAPAPLDAKSLADLSWWELYKDPVLDKLIATALQQNYDVRIAMARVAEFRAIGSVAGLGSIPQVSVGGGATRSRISSVGATPLSANVAPVRNSFDAEIDVSYELDLWKRIANLQAAARADLFASEFARDATRVSVVASVACWATGLGAQDASLRGGIAQVVSMNKRGSAFGAFNGVYGVAWFAGSVVMGMLYDHSILALVVFGVVMQAAAAVFFLTLHGRVQQAAASR